MKPACPRLFEAEALRDGRLAGAELSSFERHLSVCPHCAREVETLQALGDALRDPTRGPADADELHVRRERTRLLAAFDAALVPHERTYGARSVFVGIAAALALIVALFVYFRPPAVDPGVGVTDAVVVHADSNASWSRQVDGTLEKIVLERGALSIRVDPTLAHSQRRLLVVLPDGELEDIGTTFTVSADAGRTTRVSVQSGSVVLRLRGQPPLALGAGDTWIPSPPAAPSASTCTDCESADLTAAPASPLSSAPSRGVPAASSTPSQAMPSQATPTQAAPTQAAPTHATPSQATPSQATPTQATPTHATPTHATPTHATPTLAAPTHAAPSRPRPFASHSPSASASHSASVSPSHSASALEPKAAHDFRAAMTALDSGDNATAAARFADFLAAHPGDARAEDAAYLRVIALQRAGKAGPMKEAAAQYLRRYPRGFRRAEVETLSR